MSLLKGIDRMRDMLLEKRNVLRAGFRPTTRYNALLWGRGMGKSSLVRPCMRQ